MDDNLIETIEGSFYKTIFRSSDYMVSLFMTSDGSITVTGPSFDYDSNSKYVLVGKYVIHPKYGFQFELISLSKYIPSAKEEIIKYLSSPIYKGIGKKAAEKIYAVYGDDTLRILKNDINAINEVNLTESQKRAIIDGFSLQDDNTNDIVFELINLGYTSKEANQIYIKYKEEVPMILQDNPYRLYLDMYGIPFKKVVECSEKINIADKELKYKEALLIYLFKEVSFRTGDIYLYEDDFSSSYYKNYSDFDIVLDKCLKDKYLIQEDNRYYLKNDYYDEFYISKYLNELNNDEFVIDEINLKDAICTNESSYSIQYDANQISAIENFFNNPISLIVGGPGTGKTTIIKAIVEIYNNFFPFNNVIVIAPTGRAAKRINEICDVQSKTIHSLLRWNKEDNTFAFDESNPILYDAIIIDEFSMVDNSLFASLLKASSRVKKICIIGDDNQLPSIRQGNVLKDLIDSNIFPLTRLTNIHRQKEGNEIIDLAYEIINNQVNFDNYHNDVTFVNQSNFSKNDLINMIDQNLLDGYSLDDIQILSPMYRGQFGIDSLNLSLQSSFNPEDNVKVEKRIGDTLYRENDKILQLKNRPDDDVYNGDIGVLEEIDILNRTFLINYNDIYIYYSFDDLNDISLAYSMSVHKSQGSEYNIVYFICSKQHSIMLYKKLIYTAISRAKHKLIIIGDRDTFNRAIKRDLRNRKTTLVSRLLEYK